MAFRAAFVHATVGATISFGGPLNTGKYGPPKSDGSVMHFPTCRPHDQPKRPTHVRASRVYLVSEATVRDFVASRSLQQKHCRPFTHPVDMLDQCLRAHGSMVPDVAAQLIAQRLSTSPIVTRVLDLWHNSLHSSLRVKVCHQSSIRVNAIPAAIWVLLFASLFVGYPKRCGRHDARILQKRTVLA
jgi:hypothetical protein